MSYHQITPKDAWKKDAKGRFFEGSYGERGIVGNKKTYPCSDAVIAECR
jgi:hypothetical protein